MTGCVLVGCFIGHSPHIAFGKKTVLTLNSTGIGKHCSNNNTFTCVFTGHICFVHLPFSLKAFILLCVYKLVFPLTNVKV